jgi:CRP/FNR family transcriptional regulator, cyclic AMP receptor protein
MFQQANLTETLQGIPWFIDLRPDQIERLARIARLHKLNSGEDLFTEGGKQDYLYVLLEGEIDLEMFIPTYGQCHIFRAEPLDIIGWDPLTPVIRQRFGNARAVQPCLLIAFYGEALRFLCEEDHELGFTIYRRLTNVVASRMLNVRLCLTDAIIKRTDAD